MVGFNAALSDALPAWCVETVTKQAKLSCQSFLKTGIFQCGAMDVKRFYEKHVLHKYTEILITKRILIMQQSTGHRGKKLFACKSQ